MNKPEIVFELIVIYLNIMSYFDDGGNGAEVWQQEEELKEWQQEHYNKFSDNKDLKDTIDMIISEIKEIGSGLNDSRKQLSLILKNNNYDKIIVENKDRLTRFGFNYIQLLTGNKIEVINETNKKDEDLIELLSQIDIDKEIPDSMYKAVAEIFSFIYDLSNNKNKLDERLKEKSLNRI